MAGRYFSDPTIIVRTAHSASPPPYSYQNKAIGFAGDAVPRSSTSGNRLNMNS
jgi:hypothetical protein